jgi:hypothetical protein
LTNESKKILEEHITPPKTLKNSHNVSITDQKDISQKESVRRSAVAAPVDENTGRVPKEDQEMLKEKQVVKYVQYVPKKFGHEHLDIDSAIRKLYRLNVNNISPSAPRPKFGSLDTTSTGNDVKLQTKFEKVKGFMYGPQARRCLSNHVHSRECSKVKDIDLASLQTLAFQFMLL